MDSSGSGNLAILREAPKYSILRPPYGILLVARDREPAIDMSNNYAKIDRANEQIIDGLRPIGVRKIPAAQGTAYCWESASRRRLCRRQGSFVTAFGPVGKQCACLSPNAVTDSTKCIARLHPGADFVRRIPELAQLSVSRELGAAEIV